jgi:hypothetical protein
METFKKICIAFLMAISVRTYSQEFIGSNIRFSKESEHCNRDTAICRYSAVDIGIIKLNEQNNQFDFDVSLFPILSSPRNNDSIISMNRNIYLNYRITFPVNNLEFYESNSTESSFAVPGELTINGITNPVIIYMGIFASAAQDVEYRDVHTYPVRISFMLDINPGDFKLDFETINFVRSITVEVRNGVINKAAGKEIVK